MLQSISWASFIGVILMLTAIYYGVILALFYRQEVWAALRRKFGKV
jgi:hypothetical protein